MIIVEVIQFSLGEKRWKCEGDGEKENKKTIKHSEKWRDTSVNYKSDKDNKKIKPAVSFYWRWKGL